MQRLDASALIDLSERGAMLGNARRALLVIEASGVAAAGSLRLGQRDRLLMRIRAALFGRELTAQPRCGACGEAFEIRFTAADVGLEGEGDDDAPAAAVIEGEGGSYTLHALTADDMIAAEAAGSADRARATLLTRAAPDAPPGALDPARAAAALEVLDPLADISLAVHCPSCGAEDEQMLDVPGFVWREIEQRVPRLLREVADLARAFHWSERDILAMPAARRNFYLAAAAAG